jgi:hypothetical protein
MIELIATASITVASALLFLYWFRYTCLLIVSAKTAQDFASQVARANRLQFLEVQSQLQMGGLSGLDLLQDALNRDYETVSEMLRQAEGETSLEAKMLGVHFRMLSVSATALRRVSAGTARNALEQMSQVVAHFANSLGEHAVAGAAAR